MFAYHYDLQLFAQQPSTVTGTENYVDPFTGNTQAFDSENSMSAEMKTFYDTNLLVNARPNLVYAQFGRKQGLPAHRGKTVEFRKPNKLPNAKPLTEGVIPDAEKFGVTAITAALTQHGPVCFHHRSGGAAYGGQCTGDDYRRIGRFRRADHGHADPQ